MERGFVNPQDVSKNSGGKQYADDAVKSQTQGNAKRRAGQAGGEKFRKDSLPRDAKGRSGGKDKDRDRDKDAAGERLTAADHDARAKPDRQSIKNSGAAPARVQKQYKEQTQNKTPGQTKEQMQAKNTNQKKYQSQAKDSNTLTQGKQNIRAAVKPQKRDGEPHEPVTAENRGAQGTAGPGSAAGSAGAAIIAGSQKPKTVKTRQPQGNVIGSVTRPHDTKTTRQTAARAPAQSGVVTGGPSSDTALPRPYGQKGSQSAVRGRYSQSAHTQKIKPEENIDDIKADIVRIEKEIDLEIMEIQSLRLTL
jgi:hypothetical protein